MIKTVVSRIFLFICMLSLLASCTALQPLEFRSVSNVYVTSEGAPQLAFDLNLYNPNTMGAKLKDFNVDVSINGANLATAQLLDVTHAGAKSAFTVPVSVTATLGQMMMLLPSGLELLTSGATIPVHVEGSLTVKKFIVKKTFPFEADENIDLKKIRIGK